jgi:hypothetical protein
MWCVVEREVNKQPQSTLTSVNAKISGFMTVIDREAVILAYKKYRSPIEAVVEASMAWHGMAWPSKKYVSSSNINLS